MATSFAATYLGCNHLVEVASRAVPGSSPPCSRGKPYGGEEDILAEVERSEVQQGGEQECPECDAPAQGRHPSAGEGGPRRKGKEPEAGNRDRAVGSPEEGRQGPAEEEELQSEEVAVEAQS